MNASLLQRQAALAGVALLAALGAFALGGGDGSEPPPESVATVAPATQWRAATVGIARQAPLGCGASDETVGVVHPVLPCGAQVVVERRGTVIRTEVVGRGPVGLEYEFDLTSGLASRLGLEQAGEIRWRFAE